MKLFKRIFGFLISLSLVASFYTTAYATDFIDDEYISYKTAVGVMSGIGIISGYSNNSFRPYNTISREEAAKMIAYTLLGPKVASNLSYTKSRFSDITEGRWSLPFIEWCADNSIISGRGDGTFDPCGKVTSYELAKMLLCATGYGKDGEYIGSSWEYNAARDAFIKGIFNSSTNELSGNATREQAALYIYNAVTNIEQVKYINGSYNPVDGTLEKDNTIARANFGISEKSIVSGVITGNSANRIIGTRINDVIYNESSDINSLGHYVTLFTNGKSGSEQIVYYIEDNCKTIILTAPIKTKEALLSTFGIASDLNSSVFFFDKNLQYSKMAIEGFSYDNGSAPSGSYVINGSSIIAYFQ